MLLHRDIDRILKYQYYHILFRKLINDARDVILDWAYHDVIRVDAGMPLDQMKRIREKFHTFANFICRFVQCANVLLILVRAATIGGHIIVNSRVYNVALTVYTNDNVDVWFKMNGMWVYRVIMRFHDGILSSIV